MNSPLRFGCNGRGAQHVPGQPISVDEQFRMVKESGLFGFFDRMPQPDQEIEYIRASEKYGLPMTTGLWSYTMGKDETLPAQAVWSRENEHRPRNDGGGDRR